MNDFRVLIVDDERDILDSLSNIIHAAGYDALTYSSAGAMLAAEAWKEGPAAALVDLSLRGESGVDALAAMREKAPQVPCAVISGTSEIRSAVRSIQAGAREFFEKPLEAGRILAWLGAARVAAEAEGERRQLLEDTLSRYELVGSSQAMSAVRAKIAEYAPLRENVLVSGETGTGKELVAAQLHYRSPRRSRPFRAVNIAALSPDLIESQLFGHLKGSFSGATERNDGLIIASSKSTLFLDEIGELRFEAQAKLLRVLQDREVLSIGSNDPRKVDLRFVCATNRDLAEEAAGGRFRKDLYYRVSELSIKLPPLRERIEDIPELSSRYLSRVADEHNSPAKALSVAALDKLAEYAFPGNVRELQSLLLRAALASRTDGTDEIGPDAIRFDAAPSGGDPAVDAFRATGELSAVKRALEKRYIDTQLALHGYSVPDTAADLGLLPTNLYRRIRSLGIGSK
jgi:DNA-binding NtrC family response regulator